jgi:colanic acid biosynthesis glycosyl transferase WcaI
VRALITTQVFPPEIHPTAVMAQELAEGLSIRGWTVTIACGLPHHPQGRVADGYGSSLFLKEYMKCGCEIRRLWHPTLSSRKIGARLLVMGSQMIASTAAAISGKRPSVVLSFGGPPLLGPVMSGLAARMWKVPLVTAIHDLYPDVAEETGNVSNPLILAGARSLERLQNELSEKIVVLGPRTRGELLSRGVPEEKLAIIPVWLDPNEIVPQMVTTRWRREHGIYDDKFVVLYAGTVGIISGAEVLAEAAMRLPPGVVLVVVGGGRAWENLAARREVDVSLSDRLILLPYQKRPRLGELQASANLSIVTMAAGRGRTSVPSKVQGYMAAGRPVLASVDSESDTADLVRRGNFGMVVPPGDAEAIVQSIIFAMRNPTKLAEWGRNARVAFEAEYSRAMQVQKFATLLTDAVDQYGFRNRFLVPS